MIKGYLAADKMLAKSIKDHPIVFEDYAQWLVSSSGIKEAMNTKTVATNLKYKVYEISHLTNSDAKSINELNTSVAVSNKADNAAISKLAPLTNKLWPSEDAGVQGGCKP